MIWYNKYVRYIMEYIDVLDEVLLSDAVVDNFYDKYNNSSLNSGAFSTI